MVKYYIRITLRRLSYSSSSSETKHSPISTIAVMQMTVFTTPSLSLFFPSPRTSMSRERIDEIRNADHDRTIGINCSNRRESLNKGERNSIFIFTCVPLRDKRIFTSLAEKSLGSVHFPREYIMLRLTWECMRMITMYFLHCITFLNMILLKNSMIPSTAHNSTILHTLLVFCCQLYV